MTYQERLQMPPSGVGNYTAGMIVDRLFENLNDRSGFDTGGLDEETLTEWREQWIDIVSNTRHSLYKDPNAHLAGLGEILEECDEAMRWGLTGSMHGLKLLEAALAKLRAWRDGGAK